MAEDNDRDRDEDKGTGTDEPGRPEDKPRDAVSLLVEAGIPKDVAAKTADLAVDVSELLHESGNKKDCRNAERLLALTIVTLTYTESYERLLRGQMNEELEQEYFRYKDRFSQIIRPIAINAIETGTDSAAMINVFANHVFGLAARVFREVKQAQDEEDTVRDALSKMIGSALGGDDGSSPDCDACGDESCKAHPSSRPPGASVSRQGGTILIGIPVGSPSNDDDGESQPN